jgi:hypothetical protein
MQRQAKHRISYVMKANMSAQSFTQSENQEEGDESVASEYDSQEENYLITDIGKIKRSKNRYNLMQENLENGEPINFLFRIPEQLRPLAAYYKTMKVY